jgi:hypothetical protein
MTVGIEIGKSAYGVEQGLGHAPTVWRVTASDKVNWRKRQELASIQQLNESCCLAWPEKGKNSGASSKSDPYD